MELTIRSFRSVFSVFDEIMPSSSFTSKVE